MKKHISIFLSLILLLNLMSIAFCASAEQTDLSFQTVTLQLTKGNLGTNGEYRTGNHAVTNDFINLNYGDAFIVKDDTATKAKTYDSTGNYSINIYVYDENGNYINNDESLLTSLEYSDIQDGNFVVKRKQGLKIKIRVVHWVDGSATAVTSDEIEYIATWLSDNIKIYSTVSSNTPVFDASTAKQCWSNTSAYESWATNSVVFNENNGLYYFFYTQKSTHTSADGIVTYRTSSDCENWSQPVEVVSDKDFDNESTNFALMGVAFSQGELVVGYKLSADDAKSACAGIMHSKDNGKTWTTVQLAVDSNPCYIPKMLSNLGDGVLAAVGKNSNNESGIVYSKDNGYTWNFAKTSFSYNEASLVKLGNGKILISYRNGSNGLYLTYTDDDFTSFSTLKRIPFNDNNIDDKQSPSSIYYDSSNDKLEIYYIDRMYNFSLNVISTTGLDICNYIDGEDFVGYNSEALIFNKPTNMSNIGYPEIVSVTKNEVKLFYYADSTDGESTVSFYSMDGYRPNSCKVAGHNIVADKTVEPTCQSEGYTIYKCSKCDLEYVDSVTDKINHNEYIVVTTRATSKQNGYTKHICSTCNTVVNKSTIYYPKNISLSKTAYTYDGKAKSPSVTVKDSNGNKLVKNKDYKIVYDTKKTVGKHTVKIKFINNYVGTVTKYYTIKPKTTSVTALTSKSKGFTVKWKKQATQTTGYQIQYSTSSKFGNAKLASVTKNSTVSKTVSNLSKNKKYYVRVRTYKTVDGKKYYSSWSKAKAVKTK